MTSRPGSTVTLPPGYTPGPDGTVTLPESALTPSMVTRHVAAVGHPGVLTGAAIVLLVALAFVVATVRRSIGPRARQIVLASLRVDRRMQLTVASCIMANGFVLAAAIVGLPKARGIVGIALVLNLAAGLFARWLRRFPSPATAHR